jgi:hypothetical protein
MGGKSCLAVTLPLGQPPSPGLVNPCLTARDHISPEIRVEDLGWSWGYPPRPPGTAAFLQHSARTLPRVAASVWHRQDGLGYWESTGVD